MTPIHRRPARNPNPFRVSGANATGNNTPDDTKYSKNSRRNINAAPYPYPSPFSSTHGGQATASTTPSRNQVNSIPINAQGDNRGPQTVVQASQPTEESSTVSTSIVSTTTSTSSTTSFSSSSTSLSSTLTRSTTAGLTLTVPPPNFSTHPTSTIPPSLSFRSQTFSDTEYSSVALAQETADVSTPPPIQLSPTAIGILIAIAGTILIIIIICILRLVLRQCRHKRRRLKESALDFSRSNGKNRWDTGDGEKSRRTGMGDGSPSTIFGGNDRLTPQPSWMTFQEADRIGPVSPYPLGLLPPPVNIQRAPSLRTHTGFVPSHQEFYTGYSKHNETKTARQINPRNVTFEPPTITITNSSPRQSAPWVAGQTRDRKAAPKLSSSGSDDSPANSYNRVSVYADPVWGARLVEPPRLKLVNDDPSLSESDGGPRQSGWSSWDDSVGVELGVTIDRKHLPPRRSSRIPVSKAKKGVSPLRITLAPVQEVSDTSDPEALKIPQPRSTATATSKLHPQSPYGQRSQLRRGPASPTPLKRSPRSGRSASPRALKQPQHQTLYDLPQFEVLSPSGNSSIRVASPNSVPTSPAREPEREQERGTGSLKRRSKRTSRRASSKHTPAAAARPSSVVSEALSDMYAYVQAYALSSTESEEIQVRRRSKPNGKPRWSRSPQPKDVDRLAHYGSLGAMGSSPAVSDTVGALMVKPYGEEGSIPSPSILQLSDRGKGRNVKGSVSGKKENVLKDSNRANVPQVTHSVGLGLAIQKQQSQPRRQQSRIPQSTRQNRTNASTRNQNQKQPSFSPTSEHSEYPDTHLNNRRHPNSSRSLHPQQQRGVPSLPPPGMPNLHQLKLMRDMPDYRSPTYSVYGMYRDENRASPLLGSPLPVTYRYASPANGKVARLRNEDGCGARRAGVI